jgi:gamma-glutamyltranspeptidase/glutathione hydrolase
MSAAEAMRSNRLHNQIIPNVSQVERSSTHQGITVDGFSEEVVEGLKGKGHAIEWVPCEWTLDTDCSTAAHGVAGAWAGL